ncbi:MAG: hypothetical protein OXH00_09475 [Candidatus Poribacteria bacterium]|nr:hypothetical protein [Candidatus Poribacteria bacterium]
MLYKIFVTLLMFSILMICLAQNFTEEAADTANPFIAQLSERLRPVWSFVYSPDGKTLVCGRTNGSIAVYDTQNGQEIAQLRERTLNPPRSLAYSPDGKTIACGSSDGSVHLYDAKTAKLITKIGGVRITRETTKISAAHQRIWGLAYSPDGRMLATGGSGGNVYLYDTETWDVEKAERITEHKEHPVTVTRLRFSPDGKTFVSESSDGTLYLWKTPSQ